MLTLADFLAFTATKNPTTLTFEFFASDYSDAYLDNVVIVRS